MDAAQALAVVRSLANGVDPEMFRPEYDGRTFREAVQLTKSDAGAACATWSALEAGNPENTAILFNLGLCAESRDELREAHGYYQRVIARDDDDDYARQGVARIEARWHANAQIEARRSS